jgi:hypothetical protein
VNPALPDDSPWVYSKTPAPAKLLHMNVCIHLICIEILLEVGWDQLFVFAPFNNPHPAPTLIMTTLN